MQTNDEKYQRVGRYLDGENIDLTGEELALAEEIRTASQRLAGILDVQAPDESLSLAGRKMMAELAKRPQSGLRAVWRQVARVAAVLLIAVLMMWLLPSRPSVERRTAGTDSTVPTEILTEVDWRGDQHVDLDLIARQLEEIEAEILVTFSSTTLEMELDNVRQELGEFWLEEADNWLDEG